MQEIFNTILSSGEFEIGGYLLCLLAAGLCGAFASFAASFRSHVTKSFIVSLVLLPMIVATVIAMVNGNVGTGVAVMGAFSLVRFRSVAGKARDIAAIFLAMTSGLACAAGYVVIALLFTILVCAVMILLSFLPFQSERSMDLHVTVPETLRFAHQFDDLFDTYTRSHRLLKTKTSDMGSLYKLLFRIEMKDPDHAQEFLDGIRTRNVNLEVSLAEVSESGEEL